mmetsp:Transcript_7687/g.20190  ORF Transcript_7687/g.20190 Transcript_7687/m.20190 type:complete len:197 (+) Transcript_7687:71-661(+)
MTGAKGMCGSSSPASVLHLLSVEAATRSPSPALLSVGPATVSQPGPSPSGAHRRTRSAPAFLHFFCCFNEAPQPSPSRKALALQRSQIDFKADIRRRLEANEDVSPTSDWRRAQARAAAVQARRGAKASSRLSQPPRTPPSPSPLTNVAELRQKLEMHEALTLWQEDQQRAAAVHEARCRGKGASPLGLRSSMEIM